MKLMREVKKLIFEIELNRQRLHHAIKSDDASLFDRTCVLQTHLLTSFYDTAKQVLSVEPTESKPLYLVFSEAYQDGVRMSESEYERLLLTMDREDYETHVAYQVAPEMCADLDAVLQSETLRKVG